MVKVRDQEMRHTQLLKASQMAKTQLQELVPNASDNADEQDGISQFLNANYVKGLFVILLIKIPIMQ